MKNMFKNWILSIIGVFISIVVVMIITAITKESIDSVAAWVALGIAGGSSMTKMDRY